MDNRLIQTSRVKSIYAYLKDSIKFYDIQNPLVAQISFVVQLAIIFGGYAFARPYTEEFFKTFEQISVNLQSQLEVKPFDISFLNSDNIMNMLNSLSTIFLILVAINSLAFIVSLFYGTYYYYSLTHPSMEGSERVTIFFRRLPKIIIFNILYYSAFAIVVGSLILITVIAIAIIPFLSFLISVFPLAIMVFNTMFIFKNFLIIEFDVGIFRNFKKALDITKGCKKNVIINGLWPLCMGWLLSTFAVDIQNPMLSLFITAFFEVIILMISQRLTVLMFIDAASLERHDIKRAQGSKQS